MLDKTRDLSRRTASDKVLCDKALNVAKYSKHNGHQSGLASIVYKCFDKKWSFVKRTISRSTQTKFWKWKWKFKKGKVYSYFKNNIWVGWSCRYAINKQI